MTLLTWETMLLTADVTASPVELVADAVGAVPVPDPEIPKGLTCEALAEEGVDAALVADDAPEPPTTTLRPIVTPKAGLLAPEAEAGVALLTKGVTPPPLIEPPDPVAGGGEAAEGDADAAAGDGLLAGAEEPAVARLADMIEPALPFVTTDTDAIPSAADTASETIVSLDSRLLVVAAAVPFANGVTCRLMALGK